MITLKGDRALIQPDVAPKTTASGLELPDHWVPETSGRVVVLGDGPRAEDGTPLDHFVAVGDRVIFSMNAGHDVVYRGTRYIVLRESEILGVLE